MPDNAADSTASHSRELVCGHIDRGIEAAQREDLDAALDALTEAERLAEELGAPDLIATARINMGFAHWERGDVGAARRHYAEGAEIARDNDDTERLRSALVNFGAASRQVGMWDEAVIAFEEYLTLGDAAPGEEASVRIDCGLSLIETNDYQNATSHLEKAEAIATGAGLTDLAITARVDQGVAKERGGDRPAAIVLYESAADMARKAGNDDLVATAVLREAFAYRPVDLSQADQYFSDAEDLYRSLGKQAERANTLYWHAAMLMDAGMRERALALWREEEGIRRELKQDTDLGDCLLGQARVLRDHEEWLALEATYSQAAEAYERGGSVNGLAETRLLQSRLLRMHDRTDEAMERSAEALDAALDAGQPAIECRVRGLRAMLLAEKGETPLALQELDTAEATSLSNGLAEQATWAIARRAYVMAHMSESPDEVALQLRAAYRYGTDTGRARLGRRAAMRMISEIKANCDEKYAEPLNALKAELRAGLTDAPTPPQREDASTNEGDSAEPAVQPATSLEEARENESE